MNLQYFRKALLALCAFALLLQGCDTEMPLANTPISDPSLGADGYPGSKIAFSSDRDAPGVSAEIYVLNWDGSEEQLTETAGNSNGPAWSPNGQWIAFHSNRGGGAGESDIYVMRSDGSDVRRLTDLTALGLGGAHFANWSPDGQQVVFNSFFGGQPRRDIYVVNIDGSGLVNLTNHPADDTRADWSPDGRTIAFTSNRDGDNEIFLINSDGSGEPTQLTDNTSGDANPEWSPNGLHIAFASNRGGSEDLYVMNADGTGQTRLGGPLGVRGTKPSWSPDGRKIAFHRNVLGPDGRQHLQVFTMNADGTNVKRVTEPAGAGFNGFPSWAQGMPLAVGIVLE